jgi:hypothetical protein
VRAADVDSVRREKMKQTKSLGANEIRQIPRSEMVYVSVARLGGDCGGRKAKRGY